MSFILKALKKSQRERELRSPKTPTLKFDHAAIPEPTKSRWPLALAVTLGVNVVLLGYLFWPQGQVKLAQIRLHELIPGAIEASTVSEATQPAARVSLSEEDEFTVEGASPAPVLPVEPSDQQQSRQTLPQQPNPTGEDSSGNNAGALAAEAPSLVPRPEDEATPSLAPQPAIKAQPTKPDDAGETPAVASSGAPDLPSTPQAETQPQGAEVSVEVSKARATPEPAPLPLDRATDAPVAQSKPATPVPAASAGSLEAPTSLASSPDPQGPVLEPLPEPREVAALPETVVPATPEPADSHSGVASPSAAGSHTIAALARQTDLPRLRQMSSQFRSSLPQIEISVHIFDENPNLRLVRINRKKYREGDTIADSLRLDEITPNGVILTFDSTQFWMARP